jgi:4-diphosphocytidyl-2-C-methyl-D-erythritol kinase
MRKIPMHRAYAKINLGLRILERRPDGFHNIETVFHRIALHDELNLEPAGSIEVTSSLPTAPGGEANICYGAARLLQERLGVRTGARISIQKAIPVGAGLGGGSADAALVLRELPRLWGLDVPETTLRDLALQLGSDVPYFLGSGSALARGRGEQLSYTRVEIPYTILLCSPDIHVSTAWAYRGVAASGARDLPDLLVILRQGLEDPALLRRSLINDFEPTVFASYPEIQRVKETMLDSGAVYASMSGSGSSVFGLFAAAEDAAQLAGSFRHRGFSTSTTPPGFIAA